MSDRFTALDYLMIRMGKKNLDELRLMTIEERHRLADELETAQIKSLEEWNALLYLLSDMLRKSTVVEAQQALISYLRAS